jgi:transposase
MSPTTNAVDISTIGIDTGKNTLHLIGVREQRMIVLREKLARGRIGGRIANVPPCLIGIEAGIGTHYVARELISLGHDVKRMPPAYAKPFANPQECSQRMWRRRRFQLSGSVVQAVFTR